MIKKETCARDVPQRKHTDPQRREDVAHRILLETFRNHQTSGVTEYMVSEEKTEHILEHSHNGLVAMGSSLLEK
jgi:hypothetical protein